MVGMSYGGFGNCIGFVERENIRGQGVVFPLKLCASFLMQWKHCMDMDLQLSC
jgi:hypothetical protein